MQIPWALVRVERENRIWTQNVSAGQARSEILGRDLSIVFRNGCRLVEDTVTVVALGHYGNQDKLTMGGSSKIQQ